MKKSFVFILLIVFASAAYAGEKSAEVMEKLRALKGKWQAAMPEGNKVVVSYDVVSNGSAIVEKMEGMEGPMLTVYHPDGDTVMLTHYCETGNQPRMRAELSGTGQEIPFRFVDASNMAGPDAAHMRQLVVTFKDADHFTQQWTFSEKGKEQIATFNFERVK